MLYRVTSTFHILALFLALCLSAAGQQRGTKLVSPDGGAFAGQVFYTNSHALIIGINKYLKLKDSNLQYAVQDAKDLREMLIKSYGFPAENITMLLDGDA